MTSVDSAQAPDVVRGRMAAELGSLAEALAASSCCLLPAVLFALCP